jgi:hypothetical protein
LRNNAEKFEEFKKNYEFVVKDKFLEGDSDDEKDKKGK